MSERIESQQGDARPVNWKRTDSGVEIYDETDPDAWVRMEFVSGIDPDKRLFGICDDCGLVVPQPSLPSENMTCGDCGAEFESER